MSTRKTRLVLTERLTHLETLIGRLPIQDLPHEQSNAIARRLLDAGFSFPTIATLTGMSRRQLYRLRDATPIQPHPLIGSHPPTVPTRQFHPNLEDYCIWTWYGWTGSILSLMIYLAHDTGAPIDDILGFYLTAFHGPNAYTLQLCRLCERHTPRRRGESTVCVVCRKQGLYARDKAARESAA